MRRRWTILFAICTPVIGLDYWSKALVHGSFRLGESLPLIEHLFSFTYVRNHGAAFGLLARAPDSFREPFFFVVPLLACAFVLHLYWRMKEAAALHAISLSLILAGALGNVLSRARYGYVVDFLDLHWKDVYHWPAFNVADCAIVVAVTLLFLESIKAKTPVNSDGMAGS